MKNLLCAATAIFALMTVPALAADKVEPAVVYDLGGKFDKSFNEGVSHGAEAFKTKTGGTYRDYETQNDSQIEQALRNFARKGFSPILSVGFSQAEALKRVSKEFPKLNFAIIDSVVDAPNVQSIVFREEQGSYLAGALAAMASKTGKVGFVGGMDVPLIRKFACGYVQGAKAVNPQIEVFQNMTGTTGAAWNDPVKGGELARAQIEKGADVIFQAAGATGLGVLQTVADAGKLGIGVDSNQNYLHPDHMLTSMVKRVDVATEKTFTDAKNGTWKPGVEVLGLAEGGVDLAFDQYNEKLVTPEQKAKIDSLKKDIIAGTIKVHDYMTDNACP